MKKRIISRKEYMTGGAPVSNREFYESLMVEPRASDIARYNSSLLDEPYGSNPYEMFLTDPRENQRKIFRVVAPGIVHELDDTGMMGSVKASALWFLIFAGTVLGFIAAFAAWIVGLPNIYVFLVYCAVGSAGVLGSAVVLALFSSLEDDDELD